MAKEPKQDPQAKWWKEDANRLNKLAEAARKKGVTIKVKPKEPKK